MEMEEKQSLLEQAFQRLENRLIAVQRQLLQRAEELTEHKRQTSAAQESFALGVIDVLDLLETLLRNDSVAEDALVFLRKVEKRLTASLHKQGVQALELGSKVQAGRCRVIEAREEEGKESGMIIEVCRRGYQWGERVLRPAEVISVR